jgi:activator of HSP90 ATPase
MVESSTGVGSMWNKGSWHWEERNYTVLAKKILSERIVKIAIESEDLRIKLYEMKSIEGSASITIRKSKQIFLFDFTIEIYFDAYREGAKEDNIMGRVILHEFN